MYLAVHQVRRGDEEGINAFLHRHPPNWKWPENAARLADDNPGAIVEKRVDLLPGGNSVRSYLDVLAPEDTPSDTLKEAIEALRQDLRERRNPTTFVRGTVTIRFGVEVGLENLREEQLVILWRAGSELLRHGRATG